MGSFATHLEAALAGARLEVDRLQTTHEGRPLLVRYDLTAVARTVRRAELAARPPGLWRYRELLPVEHDENVVSLGEGETPLVLGHPAGEHAPEVGVAAGDDERLGDERVGRGVASHELGTE